MGQWLFFGTLFAIAILMLLWSLKKANKLDVLLVGDRKIGMIVGGLSVAVAWTWAPALLVSSQKAYEIGLAGFLWFAVPNVIAVIFFYFLVKRMRDINKKGYTLPEYIKNKSEKNTHIFYIIVIFLIQIYGIIINLLGSSFLLKHMTGLESVVIVPFIILVAMGIAMFRGLYSSIGTDMLKTILIICLSLIFISLIGTFIGETGLFTAGMLGLSGTGLAIFNPKTVLAFGIPTAISLIAAVTIDQQQWQRGFSFKKGVNLKGVYTIAAIFFALILVMMALPGFLGVSKFAEVDNTQIISLHVVDYYFSPWIAYLLFFVILTSLIAVVSAALSAASSIFVVDIYRPYLKKSKSKFKEIGLMRWFMLLFVLIAGAITFIPKLEIIWIQMFVGSFRSALIIPTIVILFARNLTAKMLKSLNWGILLGMVCGPLIFLLGVLLKTPNLYTVGSLFPILTTLVGFLIGRKR